MSVKHQVEAALACRIVPSAKPAGAPSERRTPSGIAEVDSVCGGGFPCGAVTEVCGPPSSGRTGLLVAALAAAARREEVCGLIDAHDSFDPVAAGASGFALERLLWVRCGARLEHAFKATDLLLEGGGFGMVALDLGSSSPRDLGRIPSSYWYRFRRAVEATPTVFLVVSAASCVRSAAALILQLHKDKAAWGPRRLDGVRFRCERAKPVGPAPSRSAFRFPRALP